MSWLWGRGSISAGLDARRPSLGELQIPTSDRTAAEYERVVCTTIIGNVYEVKRTSNGGFVVSDARSSRERALDESVARSIKVAVDSANTLAAPRSLRELGSLASRNFGGAFPSRGCRMTRRPIDSVRHYALTIRRWKCDHYPKSADAGLMQEARGKLYEVRS
jgi:hypothetical protein